MVEAFGGTLTITGSLTNASGGIIAAGSGAKVLVSSGLASNAGQIQLAGGTFDNNGAALTNAVLAALLIASGITLTRWARARRRALSPR